MEKRILTTVKSRFRLFKQPHKIGDVIEIDGESLYILGIERYELYAGNLTVWYTCQRLDITDFISMRKAYELPHLVGLEITLRHDDPRWRDVNLGSTFRVDGETYKMLEYTEIMLKGTDLHVGFNGIKLHPIDRKEAKAKLFNERRRKLKLEVL